MNANRLVRGVTLAILSTSIPATAFGEDPRHPFAFFEGTTESVSTMRITLQKPYVSRAVGVGKILPDGSIEVVQHVVEQGRREFERRWQMRQVRPGLFTGTMSEAIGPIKVERIGKAYRFRFTLKNHLSAEEWITPESDTKATTRMTVRKFGIAVAHSEGWIRSAK
jgi:hypothetical protein